MTTIYEKQRQTVFYEEPQQDFRPDKAVIDIRTQKGRWYHNIIKSLEIKKELSNMELELFTSIPINIITPRVYELRGVDRNRIMPKIIKFSGRRRCTMTGNKVKTWKLAHDWQDKVEFIGEDER